MAVTIKKIAELAGVSTGTVDRALHDRGRVNPKVAQRIKQIALELDYRPNSVAKGLSNKNRNTKISVILHIQNNNIYFNDVVAGIKKYQEEIKDFGITVEIVHCPDYNAEVQLTLIDQAIEQGAKAIAIVPINSPLIRDRLNQLYEIGYPIVLLVNVIDHTEYLSFVSCNNKLVGEITAGLLNLLHPKDGKLLLFSPSFQMYGHILRAEGLKNRLKEEYPHIKLQEIYELTGDDIQDHHITEDALARFPDTDLFVCPGPYSYGNLRAIQEYKQSHEAQIICYDYSDEIGAGIQSRDICATIIHYPQELGYTALKILFEYLTTNKKPRFKNHYIRSRIIVKESICEMEQIKEEYR